MYQADPGNGGGGISPLGFASAPSSSSTGQYRSGGGGGAPRSAPQASQGPVQRTGNPQRKPAPKKKAKPRVPNINKYLAGDTTYQDQLSQLRKQLEGFKNSNLKSQGNVKLDFQNALKKLAEQRTMDLGNLQNDYAARGLINSGLYTDAINQYDTQYNQQTADLGTDQQRSLSQLLEDLTNYGTENTSSIAAARADAIRRRAEQYGITG